MIIFRVSTDTIDGDSLRQMLADPVAGACTVFEGWVRNHHEGRDVLRLEYEVYAPLAEKEGRKIIAEAAEMYPFEKALCIHRSGSLEIGECAVWVGVASAHRDEAFKACRYIIDQAKHRLPIWKKEYYADGEAGWVNCQRCAEHGAESEQDLKHG
jgi:molybdopterin synthase catalytic subunit